MRSLLALCAGMLALVFVAVFISQNGSFAKLASQLSSDSQLATIGCAFGFSCSVGQAVISTAANPVAAGSTYVVHGVASPSTSGTVCDLYTGQDNVVTTTYINQGQPTCPAGNTRNGNQCTNDENVVSGATCPAGSEYYNSNPGGGGGGAACYSTSFQNTQQVVAVTWQNDTENPYTAPALAAGQSATWGLSCFHGSQISSTYLTVTTPSAQSCGNGLNYSTYGPSCSCSSGYSQQPAGASTCTINAPTCTLSDSYTQAGTNTSSVLTYATVGGPTSGTINGSSGYTAASGSYNAGVIDTPGNYTYTMTVSNAGGSNTCTGTAHVSPAPPALQPLGTLQASPANITSGQATQLQWHAENVSTCSLSGPGIGTVSDSGAACSSWHYTNTPALSSNSTYTLTYNGLTTDVTVAVSTPQPPTVSVSLTPTPSTIVLDGTGTQRVNFNYWYAYPVNYCYFSGPGKSTDQGDQTYCGQGNYSSAGPFMQPGVASYLLEYYAPSYTAYTKNVSIIQPPLNYQVRPAMPANAGHTGVTVSSLALDGSNTQTAEIQWYFEGAAQCYLLDSFNGGAHNSMQYDGSTNCKNWHYPTQIFTTPGTHTYYVQGWTAGAGWAAEKLAWTLNVYQPTVNTAVRPSLSNITIGQGAQASTIQFHADYASNCELLDNGSVVYPIYDVQTASRVDSGSGVVTGTECSRWMYYPATYSSAGNHTYTAWYYTTSNSPNTYLAGNNATVTVVNQATPTCSLTPPNQTIPSGQNATVSYFVNGSATSLTFSDGHVVSNPTTGSYVFPAPANTTTYTATVTGPGGTQACSSSATVTKPVDICTDIAGLQQSAPSAPCLNPGATPGQCVPNTYTYNGTTCVAPVCTPLWSCTTWGSCVSGTQTCTAYSDSHTCGVSHSGADMTQSCSAPVTLNGLTANPLRVQKGKLTDLSWTGSGLPASCTLSSAPAIPGLNANPSSGATSGSLLSVGPINARTTFTLTCGAAPSSSATVTVVPTIIEI